MVGRGEHRRPGDLQPIRCEHFDGVRDDADRLVESENDLPWRDGLARLVRGRGVNERSVRES